MRCANCNVEISKEFKFALSMNKCPACSKSIINAGNMSAFVNLCQSIEGFLTNVDGYGLSADTFGATTGTFGSDFAGQVAEKLATKIITSFNVNMPGEKGKNAKTADDLDTGDEGPSVAYDPETGIKLESFDKKKSQTALQKLRDEALQGAMSDQGIALSDEVLISKDPVVNATFIEQRQKQLDAQDKIANGGGGGFRRGG